MQQIRFNYSLKNIGLSTHDDYRRNIINKTESVIRRMRWKAHFFLNGNGNKSHKTPSFGLKSKQNPPPVAEMKTFEEDVIKMIENVKFRKVNDEFANTLENDKQKIKESPNVFVSADKTRNIYEMNANDYNKLLTENITKTYKLAQDNSLESINREAKEIASDLNVANRVEPLAQAEAFITLKDHKEEFQNHAKCRLINPAKSNLGKVSKSILDKFNTEIREKTLANQWRNSDETITWFKSLDNKDKTSFLTFDIVDFYPSISEDLLDRAISWGKQFTTISDCDINIIKHARKSLLFNNGRAWTKKSNSTFDVTMGSFDGAEVCELVGLYALNSLVNRFGKNVGLYRDDGLAALNITSARLADKARKDLVKIFESFGLKITVQTNLKSVNFLDVTFDLTNGKFRPYRKPNDETLYINRFSNHPPSIIRQLPASINKRINKLSCDEETFNTASPTYNDALKQSNFDINLTYEPTNQNEGNINNNTRQNRRRNIIWYNPPYSKNVRTNIARNFLQLIDKHFPPSHKLNKLFNRHTIRVSYSCMDNMQNFIRKHNNHILNKNAKHKQDVNTVEQTCNCRNPDECPIAGKCMKKSVVYQAEVTTADNGETKKYIGITANAFKQRYRNHVKSFRNAKYTSETELSKYVWMLKTARRDFNIKWCIIKQIGAYRPGSRRCNLCLEEKLLLMKAKKKDFLNRRSEMFSSCRHVMRHQIMTCI